MKIIPSMQLFSLELRIVFQYFGNSFFNCYWVGISRILQIAYSQIIWRSQVINPNQRPKRSWRKGSIDFKTLSREVCSNFKLLKIQNSKIHWWNLTKILTFGPFAAIDGLVDSHVVVTFWDIVDVFVSSDAVVVVSRMSPILTTRGHHLTKVLLINILSHFAERGT